MGGKKPDPQKIQTVMQKAFTEAKERFKEIKSSTTEKFSPIETKP
jgi:hypothetical protein